MAGFMYTYTGDGVNKIFTVPPYLSVAYISVYVDIVRNMDFTWLNESQIQMAVAPANGATVVVKRETPRQRLIQYTPGAVLKSSMLNKDATQIYHVLEELTEFPTVETLTTDLDAHGAVPRLLVDKVLDVITPQDFGAVADGVTDDLEALQNAINYCVSAGKALVIPGGDYFYEGELSINGPISIQGAGSGGSILHPKITNRQRGLHVNSKDVSIRGLGICVDCLTDVENNFGEYATCVTVGKFVYAVDVEAPKSTNITMEDIKLYRKTGSARGTNLAIVGRVRGLNIKRLVIESVSGGDSAISVHWGYKGVADPESGLPTDIEESYHPNNITIEDIEVTDCIRSVYLSSVYNVKIEGLVQKGGYTVAQVVIGDEGDVFACTEDSDSLVYSNIAVNKVVARDIAGVESSTSTRSLVSVSGFGTSKLVEYTVPAGTRKMFNQHPFRNLQFCGWNVEGVPFTTELFNVRNTIGDVLFEDWVGYASGEDAEDISSGYIASVSGLVTIRNFNVKGEFNLLDSSDVVVEGGSIQPLRKLNGINGIYILGRTYTQPITVETPLGGTTIQLADVFHNQEAVSNKGDVLKFVVSGKEYAVRTTKFHYIDETLFFIEPSPVVIPVGTVITLDNSGSLKVKNTKIRGGRVGILSQKANVIAEGCHFLGQSQYGVSVSYGSIVLTDCVFEDIGRGELKTDGTYEANTYVSSSRDLFVWDLGRAVCRGCTFGLNASEVQYNVIGTTITIGEGHDPIILEDCLFLGTPRTGKTLFTKTKILSRCYDKAWAAVT